MSTSIRERFLRHVLLSWLAVALVGVGLDYQSIRPGFASGLQHSGEQIDQFRAMYDEHKPQPVVLATEVRRFR